MSLDTVLQIGKAFRNSENNLKYFKYVERCPQDREGNWPICFTIPVKKDFSFSWDEMTITPENQWEKLYYLKFKTSDSDSSANKFLFGDIFYVRKTDIDKNGEIKKVNDFGNYTLERGNAFENGLKPFNEIINEYVNIILQSLLEEISDSRLKLKLHKTIIETFNKKQAIELSEKLKDYQAIAEDILKELREKTSSNLLIKFHDAFGTNIQYFSLLLQYAPAFESIIINNDKISDFLKDKKSLDEKYIHCAYQKNESIIKRIFRKEESIQNLSETTKSKILNYSNFNIFIHFDFQIDENISHWYQLEEPFELLINKLNQEITNLTENGLVPSKSIYRTLCSGNDKNDIQFPGFKLEKSYKSFAFKNQDEFTDFLYAGKILNKPLRRLYNTKIDMFVFPVALEGDPIDITEYHSFFFDNKNENSLQSDPLFLLFEAKGNERFNRFDFVLSDSSGNTTNDLIEISGVERSSLKAIQEKIDKTAINIYNERKQSFGRETDLPYFKIEKSLSNILGNPQYDIKARKVSYRPNSKYQSHLLKILPLIYTDNYYSDESLLPALIQNSEFSIIHGDSKFSFLKYDLKFLLSIQKSNKFMEIINSESYQIGYMLGELAKNLKQPIKSFEKSYVGNLTRRIGNLSDFRKLKTDIEQKLIMHDKTKFTYQISYDLAQKVKNFSNKYNKDESAFGFMEAYFKPFNKIEPTEQNNI